MPLGRLQRGRLQKFRNLRAFFRSEGGQWAKSTGASLVQDLQWRVCCTGLRLSQEGSSCSSRSEHWHWFLEASWRGGSNEDPALSCPLTELKEVTTLSRLGMGGSVIGKTTCWFFRPQKASNEVASLDTVTGPGQRRAQKVSQNGETECRQVEMIQNPL